MFKGLSLDQAPPYEAPLRFFFTAAFFGIVGGFLLLFSSIDTVSAQTFAILHIFTLGFVSMTMIGAMQQMLPVLVGVTFPKPLFFSKIINTLLIVGSLLFGFGFFFEKFSVLVFSAVFLLASLLIFSLLTIYKLFKANYKSDTVWAMILSLLSLLIALFIGSHLLISFAFGKIGNSFISLLPIHGAFAFFGWVGLLIIGVTYQVIPMFYVTKDFNQKTKKYLSFFIFSTLILSVFSHYFLIFTLFSYVWFAVLTIRLIDSRKRKIKEVSIDFWKVSMFSLIVGSSLFLVSLFVENTFLKWISSVILLYGFVISLICGMLYKIIPFLAWFHISSRGFFDMPTMKEMIDERFLRYQFNLHLASLAFLIFLPKISGIFIIASNAFLIFNLYQAVKIYMEYKKRPSPFENFKK